MQVIVDSLPTHYVRMGSGSKKIVILHGWGDTVRGFQSMLQDLAKTYTVLALDLPGFGGTASPPSAWGLTDYAAFVQKFLEKIDEAHVYAIIGHSNGGAIAIRGLANGSLTAERLVLLGTAGIRGTYKGRMKALRYVVKAGKLVTLPLPGSLKKKLQKRVYHTVGSDMLVAEHLQATFKRIVVDDVRTDAPKVKPPTLLIYGEKDEQTPVWYGREFQRLIPNAQLHVLHDAEHFVHLDQPTEVMRLIKEFLR